MTDNESPLGADHHPDEGTSRERSALGLIVTVVGVVVGADLIVESLLRDVSISATADRFIDLLALSAHERDDAVVAADR